MNNIFVIFVISFIFSISCTQQNKKQTDFNISEIKISDKFQLFEIKNNNISFDSNNEPETLGTIKIKKTSKEAFFYMQNKSKYNLVTRLKSTNGSIIARFVDDKNKEQNMPKDFPIESVLKVKIINDVLPKYDMSTLIIIMFKDENNPTHKITKRVKLIINDIPDL